MAPSLQGLDDMTRCAAALLVLVCASPAVAAAQASDPPSDVLAPPELAPRPPVLRAPRPLPARTDERPPLPRHPVGVLVTGLSLAAFGGGFGGYGVYLAAQPPCPASAWICIDVRDVGGLGAALGGLAFVVGLALVVGSGTRWTEVDRERSAQAGDLAFDARGIGIWL